MLTAGVTVLRSTSAALATFRNSLERGRMSDTVLSVATLQWELPDKV